MIIVLICILLFAFLPAIAAEQPSADKVTSIITKAKLLGDNTKVVSSVSGAEAIVSTYRHRDSVNVDKDCKIDASLIAKELMITNDLGLRRVIVHFHEPDLAGNYREVSVSFAELKAFASGAVEQKDFLDSLDLKLVPEPVTATKEAAPAGSAGILPASTVANAGIAPSTTTAGTATAATASAQIPATNSTASTSNPRVTATSNAATGSASTSPTSSTPPKKNLPRQKFSSQRCGFTFLLPYGWTLDQPDATPRFQRRGRPVTSETIFVLKNPTTGYKQIECYRKTDGSSPDLSAAKLKQDFSYSGTHFDKYQSVAFGKGRYAGALVAVRYPHEAGEYHETHLFFGSPGMYYDLRGWGPTTDKTFDAAFNDLIATIEFPAAKSGAAKTVKK